MSAQTKEQPKNTAQPAIYRTLNSMCFPLFYVFSIRLFMQALDDVLSVFSKAPAAIQTENRLTPGNSRALAPEPKK